MQLRDRLQPARPPSPEQQQCRHWPPMPLLERRQLLRLPTTLSQQQLPPPPPRQQQQPSAATGADGGDPGGSGSGSGGEVQLHRADGTPLDFSSREAKVEAMRQHVIERAYEAQQAAWGLPHSLPTHSAGTETVAGDAATRLGTCLGSPAVAMPARGRGRHVVRPAWLVQMEQRSNAT